MKRITVNLAPADLRKEGPSFDLPIAVGILIASGQILADVTDAMFLGELSLDGSLRHTQGMLPMVGFARESRVSAVYVPEVDGAEATLVDGIQVFPVPALQALAAHLNGAASLAEAERRPFAN